jgi:Flp pilus assembly protein TadG
MIKERLRRQDGVVRDVLKYLVLFVVVLVLILDAVAVIQVQLSVRQQTTDAADSARSVYVETGSTRLAKQAAEDYLGRHDSTYISSTVNTAGTRDQAVVTVTGERSADTIVYKYLTHLPWLGERVENLLNPTAVGETGKSNI